MHGPTHIEDTLDLLISRGLNISSIVIKDAALSGHFCIFFDILISVTTKSRSLSERNALTRTLGALFMKVISLSISADSVDFLLDAFNSKVENVIDDISPWKSARRMADRNHHGENRQQFRVWKRQCRKAERMWRETKLEIPYSIYKDSLHAFNIELATSHKQ